MRETREVHCSCGATRIVPAGLAVVSCVRCGRAMTPEPDLVAPPRTALLAMATLASQLVGTIAFALALVSIVKFHDHRPAVVVMLAAGAACVLAGGAGHRGNLPALVACVVLAATAAVACLAHVAWVHQLALRPVTWLAPKYVTHMRSGLTVVGLVAALAVVACAAALPQAKRFAAWRDEQVDRAARHRVSI